MNGRRKNKRGHTFKSLRQDPSTYDTFSWKNDSLWYKDHLYLCNNSQLKQNILLVLHTYPLGGKSLFLETYHKVKKEFFWDGLKSDIQKFVAECLVFQKNKVETIKTLGPLKPLSIPSQCWEEISMDFITVLPKSKGKSVIMVVVDRITKYAHFCALSHPFKKVQFLLHLWTQFKSYMETQRLC